MNEKVERIEQAGTENENAGEPEQCEKGEKGEKSQKYLDRNAYGTIPHLPGSRIGTGEHHVNEGQDRICTQKVRDQRDRVIVTEKLDGANVAVANSDGGTIIALGRAGYPTESSPHEHIRMFGDWVKANEKRFSQLLRPGESVHGEWLALAHGTVYDLFHEPFVVFDMKDRQGRRLAWDETFKRSMDGGFITPRLISDGPPVSVDEVLPDIEWSGHGYLSSSSMDKVEGAVWRVEHENKFDFMAKWVRPDKKDGKYIPEVSGQPAVWCWRPEYDEELLKNGASARIRKAVQQQKPDMDLNHELSKIPGFRKSPIRALGEMIQEPDRIGSVGERTRIGGVLKGLGDFLIEESVESAIRNSVTFDHGVLFRGTNVELPFNPALRPRTRGKEREKEN